MQINHELTLGLFVGVFIFEDPLIVSDFEIGPLFLLKLLQLIAHSVLLAFRCFLEVLEIVKSVICALNQNAVVVVL